MIKTGKQPVPPKNIGGKLIDADGDEVILEASQLDDDPTIAEEGDANPEDENEKGDDDEEDSHINRQEYESEETDPYSGDDDDVNEEDRNNTAPEAIDDSLENSESTDDGVEIDGVKYSRAEIDEIFATGKSVTEYRKKHPGYDPILIHKQFTKNSQELANVKRALAQDGVKKPSEVTQQVHTSDGLKPKTDLSKFKPEEVALFNELASALGFVKSEDIEQRELADRAKSYESIKKQEIAKFLESHPEYKPENDSGDVRWSALLHEFNVFKLPEDPHHFSALLERAHSSLSGFSTSLDKKKMDEIIAKKRASKPSSSSIASGGNGNPNSNAKTLKSQRLHGLAKSGGLQGFTAEEIEDLFG